MITAWRFVLAGAVAVCALVGGPELLLGGFAALGLLSDFVDGRVARWLGTSTPFGARLDQEADAVLVLVLSAVVAPQVGWWVLGIGLARYAFGIVFTVVPALRTPPSTPRYWCKVVAAVTGIVLAVVAALPLPDVAETCLVVIVALLLAESFLREAIDRWRAPGPVLQVKGATYLAFGVVWLALVLPGQRDGLGPQVLTRLPVELLLLMAVALLPWPRLRDGLAVVVGVLLAVLVPLAVLDLGFRLVFDRGFEPVGDWSFLEPGVEVLGDSIGIFWARAVALLLGVLVLVILAAVPWATVRVVRVAASGGRRTVAASTVFAVACGVAALTGSQVASVGATSLAVSEVQRVSSGIADQRAFSREIRTDTFRGQDPTALLAGLAGHDVLLVFVESYGRVAVEGTSYSTGINQVLDAGTVELRAAGYQSRSAFLTSPTFGAGSWLAHSSLQSGLWVDSQRRYTQLLDADRLTLTRLFGQAGWRTVFDLPAVTEDWPEGEQFYGFDGWWDSRNVGYRGPGFGYTPVPDQYTLEHFRRTELTPRPRQPVMAEIDLISSHHPWTPLPDRVAWNQVGDGTIYRSMSQSPSAAEVFGDPEEVRRRYGLSIEYVWQTLVSFLVSHPDPNLVVIAVGDHQPHGYVSGADPGHDVPISVISADPSVLGRVEGWQWGKGLRPAPDAPVWRMDTFRDRFLTAFREGSRAQP